MRKVKVAYIVTRIEKGGPGCIVLNLIHGLDKKRFCPILITLFDENDNDIVKDLRSSGIQVIEYKFSSRKKFLFREYHILEKYLLDNVDIVHTHGLTPDIAVSRMNDKLLRLATIHNVMEEDYLYHYGKIKSILLVRVHKKALKRYDCVVGCSQNVGKSLKGISTVTYVRNGIDTAPVSSVTRKDLEIPENANVFIYVGWMSKGKNVVELADLFSQYRGDEDYLVLVGDGPTLKDIIQKCDSHIKTVGFQKNAIQFMKIANVYISASKSEGFPVSVLEALSCGLVLFLSDIPSHKEFFSIDKNVYLGESFNFKNFKKKMEDLKSHQWNRENIIFFHSKQLSAKVMSNRYQKIYDLLLKRGKQNR